MSPNMHPIWAVVILSSFLLNASGVHASNRGTKDTTQATVNFLTLGYVMANLGITLRNQGWEWLGAHFGLTSTLPEEIPFDEAEDANARLVLNEVLEHRTQIDRAMTTITRRLRRMPTQRLLEIITNVSLPAGVRHLARDILRREYIEPRLADGRYDEIGDMNIAFRRLANPNDQELRGNAEWLFRFEHPNAEIQLAEPTIIQFGRMNNGAMAFREIVTNWFRGTNLRARVAEAQRQIIAEDAALEQVRLRVFELEQQIKDLTKGSRQELIDVLHELHGTVQFFESLLHAQNTIPKHSSTTPITPDSQIHAALSSKGDARFPITGDFETDALILGFEQNAALISAAKGLDLTKGSHRLGKTSGNSYIRDGMIISHDRDGHADDAYKLHMRNARGHWMYIDTVILVEVGNQWMFLCLDRNKSLGKAHWFLVDTEGQWFRILRNDPNAVVEPVTIPGDQSAARAA